MIEETLKTRIRQLENFLVHIAYNYVNYNEKEAIIKYLTYKTRGSERRLTDYKGVDRRIKIRRTGN